MSRLFHYGLIKRAVCHLGICLVPFRNPDLFLKPFETTKLDYILLRRRIQNKNKCGSKTTHDQIRRTLEFLLLSVRHELEVGRVDDMSHATWFAWLFFAYWKDSAQKSQTASRPDNSSDKSFLRSAWSTCLQTVKPAMVNVWPSLRSWKIKKVNENIILILYKRLKIAYEDCLQSIFELEYYGAARVRLGHLLKNVQQEFILFVIVGEKIIQVRIVRRLRNASSFGLGPAFPVEKASWFPLLNVLVVDGFGLFRLERSSPNIQAFTSIKFPIHLRYRQLAPRQDYWLLTLRLILT